MRQRLQLRSIAESTGRRRSSFSCYWWLYARDSGCEDTPQGIANPRICVRLTNTVLRTCGRRAGVPLVKQRLRLRGVAGSTSRRRSNFSRLRGRDLVTKSGKLRSSGIIAGRLRSIGIISGRLRSIARKVDHDPLLADVAARTKRDPSRLRGRWVTSIATKSSMLRGSVIVSSRASSFG